MAELEVVENKKGSKMAAVSMVDGGKLQPQAVELEEAVLGAMMLEKNAVNDAIEILSAESFYREAHQKIFTAIKELFADTEPIDILTVTNRLRKNAHLDDVGGPYYISQLTNKVASAANIQFHARIIAQKYILRELIRISTDIVREAFDDTTDVFDLLDKAEQSLYKVAEGNIRKDVSKMQNLMAEAIKQIEEAGKKDGGLSGVPTGFTNLDRLTGGWQRSDLIIMAGRPGMGKTAFVLSMARNVAVEFERPVAVFSLEMSSLQLVNRLIASESEISAEKLRKGTLQEHEYHQLHSRINRLSEAPLFIDDTPALSVFELRAKCRRLKAQHGIELIIIDYLQLMTAGGDSSKNGGNREQEISTISRSLKGLAKELDVPIIALSQLNRSVETRGGDKRPQLSDLRESGAIEQDADLVTFVYRPEYYNITQDENGESTLGIGEIIVAKHRNGGLDNVKLRFIGHLAKFDNLESYDFDQQGNIKPNTEFDTPNTITRPSRMDDVSLDDDDDDDFGIDLDDSFN
ncbi:MAG: replicative DNA helicase [Cryomorphaceae bacterium]|nr:MAG: replicative DNA helicase [Cryomorphaceae bacterium]